MIPPWAEKNFTERQISEIEFCRVYSKYFGHGTDGHNVRIIIARMADILDKLHYAMSDSCSNRSIVKEIMGQK